MSRLPRLTAARFSLASSRSARCSRPLLLLLPLPPSSCLLLLGLSFGLSRWPPPSSWPVLIHRGMKHRSVSGNSCNPGPGVCRTYKRPSVTLSQPRLPATPALDTPALGTYLAGLAGGLGVHHRSPGDGLPRRGRVGKALAPQHRPEPLPDLDGGEWAGCLQVRCLPRNSTRAGWLAEGPVPLRVEVEWAAEG